MLVFSARNESPSTAAFVLGFSKLTDSSPPRSKRNSLLVVTPLVTVAVRSAKGGSLLPSFSTYPVCDVVTVYSPGSTELKIAQPFEPVVAVAVLAEGDGPVAVTFIPGTPLPLAFVTCTSSDPPRWGVIRPVSTTFARDLSADQPTSEVVLM